MKSYKYIALLPALLIGVASCSDDDDVWTPGPVDDNVEQGVFFDASNEKLVTLMAEDAKEVNIKLCRTSSEGTITVPIVVEEADAGYDIPQSVTFNDGELTANLLIRCENIPTSRQVPLKLAVGEQFRHTYMSGSWSYSSNVLVSGWVLVDGQETHTFRIHNGNWTFLYENVELPFKNLEGTDRYRIENFMNSGIDFEFELGSKIENSYPYYYAAHSLVPVSPIISITDYGWESYGTNEFGIFDEASGDVAVWHLTDASTGADTPIYSFFFDLYDSSTTYSFIGWQTDAGGVDADGNPSTYNFGWLSGYGYLNDENTTPFLYIYWEWGENTVE
ncbi:MAG: hypothetical protein NC043_00075 [Muribaculaceae bacterium]|nr:hypothetical protein [Muribaculaceae bacterium]